MKIGDAAEPKVELKAGEPESKELWEFRLFAIQTLSNNEDQAQRLWEEFTQDFESRATVPREKIAGDLRGCMWSFADNEFYGAAAAVRDFIHDDEQQ